MASKEQTASLDKLKKTLVEQLPKDTRVGVEKAMDAGADTIVRGAVMRVPVDTGALQHTIRRTAIKEGKKGGLYIAITAGDKTPKGYNTARIVEFGTVDTPAQPFLLPSFRINRRKIKTAIRKAIKDAILKGAS